MKRITLIIVFFSFCTSAFSQKKTEKNPEVFYKYTETPSDTLTIDSDSTHSTSRASLLSSVVPGLGQAYNGKHWKIPIIYSAFLFFGSQAYENNITYQFFRRNLIAEIDGDPNTENTTNRTAENLKANRDQFRRFRDLNMILIVVTYFLQIGDANIDAHLIQFGFKKQFALSVDPSINQVNYTTNVATGLSLKLTF